MSLLSFFKQKPELPALRLHNTLSGQLEAFVPLSSREVRMYNCGPTVYEEQHIGNLRGAILADVLRTTLALWGHRVKHVSNITDVGHLTGDNSGDADVGQDRMEESAKKQGRQAQELAQDITNLFFVDLDALGIDRKKILFAKATDYVEEQIALIKTLEEKGYAYKISDGVYFDTAKFPAYGALGNVDLAGLKEGARVEENLEKKNGHDFALWKFSKPEAGRQQEWRSPWGVGFPGWHIECTAMIFKLLGKQIDIHIGGIDLAPIHHNNEIAQAQALTGKQFVKYWLHNAFITIENKKVSKSLGNTVYLHNIVDRGYSPLALRYWYLTGHYRTPMNFTWDAIEGANTALTRLTHFFLELPKGGIPNKAFLQNFSRVISEDLDTPSAIAKIWDFVKTDGTYGDISPADKRATLVMADKVLGLGLSEKRSATKISVIEQSTLPQGVLDLLNLRGAARKNKDFTQADQLRKKIEEAGYEIQDSSQGPKITQK